MPYVTQSLLFFIINLKAKHSLITSTPQTLWTPLASSQKVPLILNDWLDPHKVITLRFKVTEKSQSSPINEVVYSFYFVDPRWQLTTPLELEINTYIKSISKNSIAPTLLTHIPSKEAPIKIWWKFKKHNDPDTLNLIVNRIVSNLPFSLPYSSYILSPLGITFPITSLPPKLREGPSLDPTSNSLINKGHLFTQKLCHSIGFLTRL
jgi:hypothetical protein